MLNLYALLRSFLTWLVGGVLIAFIGEFAVDFAREQGAFDYPTAQVEAAMSFLAAVRNQFWFWPAVTCLVGLVAGMWLDSFFRKKQGGSAATAEKPLEADYAHGLALQQIQPSLDPGNPVNTLETRLVFRNASGGPLKFTTERFDVVMFGSSVKFAGTTATIPKDGTLTILPNKGFSKEQYADFKSRGIGSVEYSIVHGHPDKAPSRRAYKLIHLDLFKKKKGFFLNWIIQNESDEPVR